MKYRKKPFIIEATQWMGFEEGPHDLDVVPFKQPEKWASGHGWIEAFKGGHVVAPGDWIITGVKGEKHSCKPDIFDAIYELVK